MTPDQNKFFYEISKNSWGEASIQALVVEETKDLYQDMLNAVEKQQFHEAALIRGRIQAWESLREAIKKRADQYAPPRIENAA
jgi:hypothetical protein